MAAHTQTTPRKPSNVETPEPPTITPSVRTEPKGKLGALIGLLRRPDGAQIEELVAATGWQAHSVRGAISGSLKKKLGLIVTSTKTEAGRVYRVAEGEGA